MAGWCNFQTLLAVGFALQVRAHGAWEGAVRELSVRMSGVCTTEGLRPAAGGPPARARQAGAQSLPERKLGPVPTSWQAWPMFQGLCLGLMASPIGCNASLLRQNGENP